MDRDDQVRQRTTKESGGQYEIMTNSSKLPLYTMQFEKLTKCKHMVIKTEHTNKRQTGEKFLLQIITGPH